VAAVEGKEAYDTDVDLEKLGVRGTLSLSISVEGTWLCVLQIYCEEIVDYNGITYRRRSPHRVPRKNRGDSAVAMRNLNCTKTGWVRSGSVIGKG